MLSSTRYYSEGSIVADSRELSQGLMVITSGHIGVELPMDSAEADEENKKPDGRTLLHVLKCGCVKELLVFLESESDQPISSHHKCHKIHTLISPSATKAPIILSVCLPVCPALVDLTSHLIRDRDVIGGTSVVNDLRWAGAYGSQADFVARSHCSVEIIKTEDILVLP